MKLEYKKILVIASNHVGNNIFCTPGIRLLKKHLADAQIDVAALNRRSVDVFSENPDITNVYVLAKNNALKKLIADYQFLIILHPDKFNQYLPKIIIPYVIIPPWSAQKHRGDQVLEFIQNLIGCSIESSDRSYFIYNSLQHENKIKKLLHDFNISNSSQLAAGNFQEKILIGLHLGTGRTAVHGWKIWYRKRDHDPRLWPLKNYIELAKQLIKANSRIKFIVTGSTNEKFLARKFAREIPDTLNLTGKTSLQELFALMKQLQLFISADTGVIHVASAANVPLIGLFGPTDPNLTGPFPLQPHFYLLKKTRTEDIYPEEVCKLALDFLF